MTKSHWRVNTPRFSSTWIWRAILALLMIWSILVCLGRRWLFKHASSRLPGKIHRNIPLGLNAFRVSSPWILIAKWTLPTDLICMDMFRRALTSQICPSMFYFKRIKLEYPIWGKIHIELGLVLHEFGEHNGHCLWIRSPWVCLGGHWLSELVLSTFSDKIPGKIPIEGKFTQNMKKKTKALVAKSVNKQWDSIVKISQHKL